MDQVRIATKKTNKSTIMVYADPKSRGYNDLIIKGGQFYAVYNSKDGLWYQDIDKLSELIDDDIRAYVSEHPCPEGFTYVQEFMDNMENGRWPRYINQLRVLPDSHVQLDQKVMFANSPTRREDYASHKLDYELRESPIPNYERLMSTIYTPAERQKLEWALGLLVDGNDVERVQKFFVICGDPGTGKSTILKIIEKMFKGYISYFIASDLGRGDSFATAAFKNAPLLAIQTDGDLSHIYDNTLINSISGHEVVMVNEKCVKKYPVKLKTMMFLATNKPVKITDAQSGLIRRLIDIYPSGHKLPSDDYFDCINGIDFELGGIAWHCLQVYKSLGPTAYDDYIAKQMISRTNDIYSFLASYMDEIEGSDSIDSHQIWRDFKNWCDEGNVVSKLKRNEFLYEIGNYFKNKHSNVINGHKSFSNIMFSNFKWDKFEVDDDKTFQAKAVTNWIDLNSTQSKFDEAAKDWPAQYATNNEIGNPLKPWDYVNTTLSQVDTSKLHWVRVPENHIVLDFDMRGPNGEKDLAVNMEAAKSYPKTYAEVSKSGQGLHLHYFYDGDVSKLKPLIDEHVECKVYKGKSALRRKLTKCNDLEIAHISSGLPLKGEKTMINTKVLKDEQHIRNLIKGALQKKWCPGTKPSIDFICTVLDEAYDSDIQYDVTDMRGAVLDFAMKSTHNAQYCVNCVGVMKFKSADDELPPAEKIDDPEVLTFYDVEVFPNLFMICFKDSDSDSISTWINPPAKSVRGLCSKALVGFNNRRYDNHILYAWGWEHYDNTQLYNLSQAIVGGGEKSKYATFPNAYNLSYADIYDFSAKKQSLKKWEIELGIDHHELGMPWDKPVPEDKWALVQSYCEDDVRATEAVFNHLHEDFVARKGLANLSGLTPNDSTNQHTNRIIFGDAKNPQSEFPFPDLAETFPGYTFDEYQPRDRQSYYEGEYPGEGGYVWVYGMSDGDDKSMLEHGYGYMIETPQYMMSGEDRLALFRDAYKYMGMDFDAMYPQEVEELKNYVYTGDRNSPYPFYSDAKTLGGIFGNVALLDIASMHPSSLEDMNFFGPYTKRFSDIKQARIDIKHGNLDSARKRMDGALAPLLREGEDTKSLAQALKIVINSVYGLTSAKFPTNFNDVRNGVHDRNKDNKVAKRGALFMIHMKHQIHRLGYKVVHVKTDSVKVADADKYIVNFVKDIGKKYGYIFEHESTYDRMCIVNKSTYIAHSVYGDHVGEWTATGLQFQVPYVFKTLFDKESPIEFRDLCETKSATTSIYLDWNEGLPEDQHNYDFVGKVSAFSPVKPGCGGGLLCRENGNGGYAAVTGTKGYRWKESSYLRDNNKQDEVDMRYYQELADEAVDTINAYGDYSSFVDLGSKYISLNPCSNDFMEACGATY